MSDEEPTASSTNSPDPPPTQPSVGYTNDHGFFFLAPPDRQDPLDVLFHADNWPQLVSDLLAFGTQSPTWIFRGQPNADWALTTRLFRDLQRSRIAPDSWYFAEQTVTGFFKERATGFHDAVPADTDLLGWLALMQHYRAPSRLLDWSASPFVAAYFALADEPVADHAVIWALNAYYCRRQYVGSLPGFPFDHLGIQGVQSQDADGSTSTRYPALETPRPDSENDLVRWVISSKGTWPLPVIPFSPDPRMAAQRAIFTCAGDLGVPVDALLDPNNWHPPTPRPGGIIAGTDSTVDPLVFPSQIIRKIVVPTKLRDEALSSLQTMGITADAMFPGLDGVGVAASLHLAAGAPPLLRDVLTPPQI